MRTRASALLPTRNGELQIGVFDVDDDGAEHVLIAKGELVDAQLVPTFIHSECLLGDVLGSLRCDCRVRMDAALAQLERRVVGVIVYVRAPPEARRVAGSLSDEAHAYKSDVPTADECRVSSALLRAVGARSSLVVTHDGKPLSELAWEL